MVKDYPLAWMGTVVLVALAASLLVILDPPTIPALVVIIVVAVIAVIAPRRYAVGRRIPGRGSTSPPAMAANPPELRRLEAELDALLDPRPAYQFHAIAEKRDNLVAVLSRRMEAGELTFGRYQATAQQVYEAVISNLREISIASSAISAIDLSYVDGRLAALAGSTDVVSQGEVASLRDRQALAAAQEAKITYLLARNESAMTLLDRTSTALADAPIGVASDGTDAAIAALTELADRAARYAGL